jgi:DNA-binding Lrp family transcriptional regulator
MASPAETDPYLDLTRPPDTSKPGCHRDRIWLYCTRDHAPEQLAGEIAMVPFFVQIKCKLGQSYAVANAIAEAEIASEIYSTAGDYDLLVKFYVDSGTNIGHFVNEKLQVIPGIQDTYTIITFKAFGV